MNGFCAFEYVYVNPDCCVHLFFWSTIPLTMSTALSAGFFFPPAPPGPTASSCKKRSPHEMAVVAAAAVENVRTHQRKQMGRQLSVFLCEVIMCSQCCFCSHANEVDHVGNHFQTLSRGKSRKGKTKARTKGRFAVACVCRSGGRNKIGCVFIVGQ